MCPLELGLCPETFAEDSSPVTLSFASYVALGWAQQPCLCCLSLSLHPSFSDRALRVEVYPSPLLQGLLWNALHVHDHQAHKHSPHSAFCSLLSWPRAPLGQFGHRLEPSGEACEWEPHPSSVGPTHHAMELHVPKAFPSLQPEASEQEWAPEVWSGYSS